MKIIYAAANNEGSAIRLLRFLHSMTDCNHDIRIAAYRKSTLPYYSVDWSLDSLLSFNGSLRLNFDNLNFKRLLRDIQDFKPDLIISDLEIFTSYIALAIKIPLWQVSPLLLWYGLPNYIKLNLNIYKLYQYLLLSGDIDNTIKNIIVNSDRRFVVSPFCDFKNRPVLNDGFEWVRPHTVLQRGARTEKYDVVMTRLSPDGMPPSIMRSLIHSKMSSAIFSKFPGEYSDRFDIKNVFDTNEYSICMGQSEFLISNGETSFLADAVYNQKKLLLVPDHKNLESIVNTHIISFLESNDLCYDKLDFKKYFKPSVDIDSDIITLDQIIKQGF